MILAVVLLAGCSEYALRPGTSVGNPARLAASVAPSRDVTIEAAWLEVTSADVVGCGGERSPFGLLGEIDLLDSPTVDLPTGEWCGVALEFARLAVTGSTWGGTFVFELQAGDLVVSAEDGFAAAADEAFVLEVGEPGWIDVRRLGVVGGDVTIDDSAQLAVLADAVARRSALWRDTDGDAVVDWEERRAGPTAAGEAREAWDDEDHGH
jgi:hypothetical protein